jgi:nucleoside-diphosphate-sugar epimerase
VIFRPGIVLGCGGSPYHWGIAGWPYTSICQLWGKGNNPLPIVLVSDVVDALIRAIEVPGIEGESFNLAAHPCITANQYLDEFERSANIKIRRVSISASKFYVESLIKWAIKAAGRDPHAAFPSYADGKGRSLAAMFDCSKAEHILGWSPISDRDVLIKEGIHLPVFHFFR